MRTRLLTVLFAFFTLSLFAQDDIELYEQFSGNYDFTVFGNTLNTSENGIGGGCTILTSSSADFNLGAGQNIVAAFLYWSGSGAVGDLDVELNNTPVTAERTFSDEIDPTRPFFAAFADVTDIVQANGGGTYTVSELDLTDIIPDYCPSGTNFGGWAVTVIYEDPSFLVNQINVFDGLESVSSSSNSITILLDNLNVMDPSNAKISFLAWEGDAGISVNETLQINGDILSNPPLNPADNAFNGTNSYTGSSMLYNMDIDAYGIENNVNAGDTNATITLTSSQDFVMINNIITLINNRLPDATIAINNIIGGAVCGDRNITIDYTVFNINSTDALPANTPIALYIDNALVAQAATQNEIPAGGSETGSISLTVPPSIMGEFIITLVVDDDGTGNGIVDELSETNNDTSVSYQLSEPVVLPELNDLEICDLFGKDYFDLTNATVDVNPDYNLTFHLSEEDALADQDPIQNPTQYLNISNPQTIWLRAENGACSDVASFTIEVIFCPLPDATIEVDDIIGDEICDNRELTINYTVYNLEGSAPLPAGTPIAFYIDNSLIAQSATQNTIPVAGSESGTITFTVPPEFGDAFTLLVVVDDIGTGIGIVNEVDEINNDFSLEIELINTPGLPELIDLETCDLVTVEVFDLTEATVNITDPSLIITYHLTEEDAINDENPIENVTNFENTENPQTIWVRAETELCYNIASFTVEVLFCEIPDAAIALPEDLIACPGKEFIIDYTVYNTEEALADLPIGTPVTLYAEDIALIIVETKTTIPIGGSEEGSVAIVLPDNLPNPFTLTAVADDNGEGNGIIEEYDETNNEASVLVPFGTVPEIPELPSIVLCDQGSESAYFDLTQQLEIIQALPNETVTFHLNAEDAIEDRNPLVFLNGQPSTANPETIWVRVDNEFCFEITTFILATEKCEPFIPDGFSPNNDGINDTFNITGLVDIFKKFELSIYSREGNLIYRGGNEEGLWGGVPNTGLFHGQRLVPVGTYYYSLSLNDPKYPDPYLGWIYINY